MTVPFSWRSEDQMYGLPEAAQLWYNYMSAALKEGVTLNALMTLVCSLGERKQEKFQLSQSMWMIVYIFTAMTR